MLTKNEMTLNCHKNWFPVRMFRVLGEMMIDVCLCCTLESMNECCVHVTPPEGDRDLYWWCCQNTIDSWAGGNKIKVQGFHLRITYLRCWLMSLCYVSFKAFTVFRRFCSFTFCILHSPICAYQMVVSSLICLWFGGVLWFDWFCWVAVAGEWASLIWNTLPVGPSRLQTYLHPSHSLAHWHAHSPSIMDMCMCVGGPTVLF